MMMVMRVFDKLRDLYEEATGYVGRCVCVRAWIAWTRVLDRQEDASARKLRAINAITSDEGITRQRYTDLCAELTMIMKHMHTADSILFTFTCIFGCMVILLIATVFYRPPATSTVAILMLAFTICVGMKADALTSHLPPPTEDDVMRTRREWMQRARFAAETDPSIDVTREKKSDGVF